MRQLITTFLVLLGFTAIGQEPTLINNSSYDHISGFKSRSTFTGMQIVNDEQSFNYLLSIWCNDPDTTNITNFAFKVGSSANPAAYIKDNILVINDSLTTIRTLLVALANSYPGLLNDIKAGKLTYHYLNRKH